MMDIRKFLSRKQTLPAEAAGLDTAKKPKLDDSKCSDLRDSLHGDDLVNSGSKTESFAVVEDNQQHDPATKYDEGDVQSEPQVGQPTNAAETGETSGTSINVGDVDIVLPDLPYQPPVAKVPHQFAGKDKKNCLKFQATWYQKFSWLHFDDKLNAVLCFTCVKAESLKLCELARKRELTFISKGFKNWKKALEKFTEHDNSASHRFAREQLLLQAKPTVDAQISKHKNEQQISALKSLRIIFSSVRYLARQGLAFRGHETDGGNFMQLLSVRSEDSVDLKKFLLTKNDMTSGVRQNEILDMFSHTIVRKICSKVRIASAFAIMVDGTQDISGHEQESICLRYIDESFNPVEAFVGIYETSASTTGQSIANCVLDVLTRLQLPISQLRGQTFDGASNMSGIYKGCQAIIAARQPLALYTHCGSHCSNLVAEKVCSSVAFVRNSIQVVQEIGAVFSASIHCRTTFARISQADESGTGNDRYVKKIKPLCPTRWLVRVPAIKDILDHYENVQSTLAELASRPVSIAARANGLAKQLHNGSTLLGLKIALVILQPLELLNKSLQARSMTVAGMLQAVEIVSEELKSFRNQQFFQDLISSVNKTISENHLEALSIPRQRRPPARITGDASSFQPTSISDHYLPQFFEVLDTATTGLSERFSDSQGLKAYGKLENVLLNADDSSQQFKDYIKSYPELSADELIMQLSVFRRKFAVRSVDNAISVFQGMVPEVRELFTQVEILLRLLMVCPASSAEAERSFSGLRRLKTWLRSTMTQTRLNSVCICHTHQDILDEIDLDVLMKDFCSRSDVRQKLFGRF